MSGKTKIEWATRTWNPIVGCTIHSPGCKNCYAMRMAARLEAMAVKPNGTGNHGLNHYLGATESSRRGAVWTGKIGIAPDDAFTAPLRRKKPTDYFVNSMSDLFQESVPFEVVDRVFAVMALSPQHIYKILTKRSDRMREYMTARNGMGNSSLCKAINDIPANLGNRRGALEMPLPNVWLGVSVEDQTRADERIPDLVATPAAIRFISAEPLLGPVDLRDFTYPIGLVIKVATSGFGGEYRAPNAVRPAINWVITGGESGPDARPMHPDWARSLRDQCAAAGIPFHFKQWGEWRDQGGHVPIPRRNHQSHICHLDKDSGKCKPNPNRFSDETMIKLGKGKSGRLLDGVEHNGMPGKGR